MKGLSLLVKVLLGPWELLSVFPRLAGYFSRGVGNSFPSSWVEGKIKPKEELAQSWKRLSLSEKEGLGYCLTEKRMCTNSL